MCGDRGKRPQLREDHRRTARQQAGSREAEVNEHRNVREEKADVIENTECNISRKALMII
jgi:hypothetical protein